MPNTTIAIDVMGGDFGADVTVAAAVIAAERYPNVKMILVGSNEIIRAKLAAYPGFNSDQFEICHASEVVEMDELPTRALRFKKDSSMRVAIDLVQQGKAQACVSAGNTGALMVTARYVLKTLPGIDRPAIIRALPTINPAKEVRVLDLGANVDVEAELLYQFAIMGSVLAKTLTKDPNPKVGLLNIGSEAIKGSEQVKRADHLLTANPKCNYIGYVEGNDIFKGDVDVVVCDGFIGNVMLKTIEGLVKMVASYVKRGFMRNFYRKCVALAARPVLKDLAWRLDPGRRNGASLIGLRGVVIKSHGGANKVAFANAIEEAINESLHNVPQKIGHEVAELLQTPITDDESESEKVENQQNISQN